MPLERQRQWLDPSSCLPVRYRGSRHAWAPQEAQPPLHPTTQGGAAPGFPYSCRRALTWHHPGRRGAGEGRRHQDQAPPTPHVTFPLPVDTAAVLPGHRLLPPRPLCSPTAARKGFQGCPAQGRPLCPLDGASTTGVPQASWAAGRGRVRAGCWAEVTGQVKSRRGHRLWQSLHLPRPPGAAHLLTAAQPWRAGTLWRPGSASPRTGQPAMRASTPRPTGGERPLELGHTCSLVGAGTQQGIPSVPQ